jgi:hypothetical protein
MTFPDKEAQNTINKRREDTYACFQHTTFYLVSTYFVITAYQFLTSENRDQSSFGSHLLLKRTNKTPTSSGLINIPSPQTKKSYPQTFEVQTNMSILKNLICAVLFLAHAASAEVFVNCMAAEDSDPLGVGCTGVNQRVLGVMDSCTHSSVEFVGRLEGYVAPPARLLRSEEHRQEVAAIKEEQSERELQLCGKCCGFNLRFWTRAICCIAHENAFSYCGRSGPTVDDRRLDETTEMGTSMLSALTDQCTTEFKALAHEYTEDDHNCIGAPEDVFCKSIEIFV